MEKYRNTGTCILHGVETHSHWQFLPRYGKIICDALRDLVPFVQFKKHEKHP